MKKQNNLALLSLLVIITVSIIAALYLVNQKANYLPKATVSYDTYQLDETVPVISSYQGLESQLNKLDQINIDQTNPAINGNDTDINNL